MTATIPKASRPLHRRNRPETRAGRPVEPFAFKEHQREDLPRAAMHDGCILSWDPGMGKSLGGMTLSALKNAKRTLFVVPAGLHRQWIKEAKRFYGIDLIVIRNQADAYRLMREGKLPLPGTTPDPAAPVRWFITDFQWLGMNGADERPATDDQRAERQGIGTVQLGIRCVAAPSLSTLVADCFDCGIVDEGVRLKSGDTYIAEGVLRLRPKFRYVLTGTPIKNRLPDIFFLAAWVTGFSDKPSARWPYGNTLADMEEFANQHMVREVNETKAEETGRRYAKRTNQITNLHHLWKLLGPVVIRRRKDQVREGIVPKIVKPIRIQPGTAQLATYRWHLNHKPEGKNALARMGKQLVLLRQAALCPSDIKLGGARSKSRWTPKIAAICGLAADLMEQGEQLVVFSPFQAFSADLAAVLREAGVPCAVLDGKLSATKRGDLAEDFKEGKYPVLIAGMKSMGEGYSFECCSHLVIPSLEWAYDTVTQAIERVHRLNSEFPVTIYMLIMQNSTDERLFSVWGEKGDASDLALDGRLFDQCREEPDLAEFMRSVVSDFDPRVPTVDEADIEREARSALFPRLRSAARLWSDIETEAERSAPPPAAAPALATAPSPALSSNPLLKYAAGIAALRARAAKN